MVSHRYIPDVHQQPINRVLFAPDAKVVMTSSESDRTSVVFTRVTLEGEPKVWSVEQVVLGDPNRPLQLIMCPHVIIWWTLYSQSSFSKSQKHQLLRGPHPAGQTAALHSLVKMGGDASRWSQWLFLTQHTLIFGGLSACKKH